MKTDIRPPWWTEENEIRANKGERIVLSAEFSAEHSQKLSDLSLKVCQAFRLYLHGDTDTIKKNGYKEALQRLRDYREYCFQQGRSGVIHYEEFESKAHGYSDAHKHSFGFALYSLYKNI